MTFHWRKHLTIISVTVLAPLAMAQTQLGVNTIDYPGAVATQAWAINAAGDILGSWQDASNNWHAYFLRGGVFIGFDCQGAVSTLPYALNSKGEAVGAYRDASGKWRGFYLHMASPSSWEEAGAKCVTVEPKGSMGKSSSTGAFGISEGGDIVGEFDDSEGKFHGVLTRGGVHFIFDVADGPWNGAFAFTSQGDMLGHVQATGDRMKGYVLTRDGLQLIEFPPGEANTMTCPFGVNSHGDIVGHYMRTGDQIRGYLYSKGTYVSIDVPEATMTDVRGINDNGLIVGFYTDKNSQTHGFLTRRP
jgi:uncharacterized membrane protein